MKTIVLLLGLCGAGCAASVGTSGSIYVPKDAAATCTAQCNEIGMGLNSVVIMANNVGCVCSAGAPPGTGGATAGGMAAIMMDQQRGNPAARGSRNRDADPARGLFPAAQLLRRQRARHRWFRWMRSRDDRESFGQRVEDRAISA